MLYQRILNMEIKFLMFVDLPNVTLDLIHDTKFDHPLPLYEYKQQLIDLEIIHVRMEIDNVSWLF
jgi:hypothetical protein